MKEQKLFVYGNSYSVRTILFHMEYLFQFSISEIWILGENHDERETFSLDSKIVIRFCDTIEEGITASDIIIMIKSNKMPGKKVDSLIALAEEQCKPCIVIKNPWEKPMTAYAVEKPIDQLSCETGDKPVILVLSIGDFAQPYCVELMLNKLFSDNSIRFRQEYSQQTEDILMQLSDYEGIQYELKRHVTDRETQPNIIIKSISIEGLQQMESKKLDQWFSEIKPDVVIISCMLDCALLPDLYNLLRYKYGINVALTIASPYVSFEKYDKEYMALYCGNGELATKFDYVLNHRNELMDILKMNIFSKLLKLKEIYAVE